MLIIILTLARLLGLSFNINNQYVYCSQLKQIMHITYSLIMQAFL